MKIDIYSMGVCTCSICVEKGHTVEEITKELNVIAPTEIESQWEKSEDTHFKDGIHTNPCECSDDPNREHYLFHC